MAINYLDFLNAPRARSSVAELLPSILQGYKIAKEPAKMAQEERQRELANALAEKKNEYYPKIQEQKLRQGDLGIRTSELNLESLPKRLQQEEEQRRLANETSDYNLRIAPEKFQLEKDKLAASIEASKRRAEKQTDPILTQRRTQQIYWDSLPNSEREKAVGMGNALGIRPEAIVQGMSQGKTFEEVAAEHGYNPEDVRKAIPKYSATTRNIAQENQRMANVAELDVLDEKISDATAPYIRTFLGYSPKQIVDSFGGRDDDALARYMAARALQPELASLRIKVMGGNIGQGAIHDVVKSALGESKVAQLGVSPTVYKKMNQYLSEWLHEASNASHAQLFGNANAASPAANNDPLGIR